MLPPLIPTSTLPVDSDETRTHNLLSRLKTDVMEAQDNLLAAKAAQAMNINKGHAPTLTLQVGNRIMLATKHC